MLCVFLIFCRMVQAFTCAGILPQHYLKIFQFAEMGVNGKWYIDKGVYVHVIVCVAYTYLSVYGK